MLAGPALRVRSVIGAVRGRFAPSPTGDLHLGNARTALLSWLQARSAGGQFILRVEDLDRGRVRPAFLDAQLRDLRWLGLDWDEGPDVGGPAGPYLQSLRQDLYDEALRKLAASGLLYQCTCSRREIIAAASAPHGSAEEGPAYPGTCSFRSVEDAEGSGALRFRVSDEAVSFRDELRGKVTITPRMECGDFVVRRKDGIAAYQLAVVVDDLAMGVTDVVRGADLLSSTARQILLYRALEGDQPRWMHVPLMLAADGERLSKRSGALTLTDLRRYECPPERIVGWLASTCGLATRPEECAPADLLRTFDADRLPRVDTPVTLPEWLTALAGAGPGGRVPE